MRPVTGNALVLGNLREYCHKWYSARNYILWTTFSPRKYLGPLLRRLNVQRKLPNSVK